MDIHPELLEQSSRWCGHSAVTSANQQLAELGPAYIGGLILVPVGRCSVRSALWLFS